MNFSNTGCGSGWCSLTSRGRPTGLVGLTLDFFVCLSLTYGRRNSRPFLFRPCEKDNLILCHRFLQSMSPARRSWNYLASLLWKQIVVCVTYPFPIWMIRPFFDKSLSIVLHAHRMNECPDVHCTESRAVLRIRLVCNRVRLTWVAISFCSTL